MKETSKKFIENKIKEVMQSSFNPVVLKRNVGHIALCHVDFMPSLELARTVSKHCGEKIEFRVRDYSEIYQRKFDEKESRLIKRYRKKLNRKAKRKRKKILKTIYRGFAPNPTYSSAEKDMLFQFTQKNISLTPKEAKPVGY